nr:immunoglobulin light chain junction region [Macaca mulatta]MOX18472.1 immunoglobulin light chain junction region [Macaca mulatta]MOX22769.1 immunoglobulin light chain junction region [Macaca mulatta]
DYYCAIWHSSAALF